MKRSKKTKEINRPFASRVLVEATLIGNDTKAARARGITVGTLRSYRDRLETDPELAGLYAEQMKKADGLWRDEMQTLVFEAARKMRELVGKARTIEDLPIVLDAMRTGAELLVQREALVFDGLDEGDREGRAAPANAANAGQVPPPVH